MIAGIFQYSYAQAKTRAMKGKLLGPDDWHYLLEMKKMDDVLRYLSGTEYAGALARLPSSGRDARKVALALYEELVNDYARLVKAVPSRGARLLRAFLLRYEAENLKMILRGIWKAEPPSKTLSLLYPLGALAVIRSKDLLQAEEIVAVLEQIKSTIFYEPLQHAMPQFKIQGSLFPLEIAADMAAFEQLAYAVAAVISFGREKAKEVTGELLDWVNVSWIIRFRHFYSLSPEETINYTLPGGRHLGIRALGDLARAGDIPSFLAALPECYRKIVEQAESWQVVPLLFQRWFIGELYRSFRKDPFQIGLQISYILLKEMEVKSLESLMSAIELGQKPEKLSALVQR